MTIRRAAARYLRESFVPMVFEVGGSWALEVGRRMRDRLFVDEQAAVSIDKRTIDRIPA
ncbi:hypothetical protein [Actinoplanes philippinensis]|uniref:hypothetical protein n=1 Tax=Actinoplanes philippinensis TaxID=35752 RepID=UPI0015A5039D|nr:hypothetical protein [Actinoplanes philippinensis]